MTQKIKIIILIISFFLVSYLSYQFGIFIGNENILRMPPSQIVNPLPEDQKIDFSVFWETWRKLEKNFFKKEKIDYQKMVFGAIKGLVASLEDPYTVYFTPEETQMFEDELKGEYQGVGMEVGIKDKKIMIIAPLENTPAQEAGLQPGDKILAIDDISTENLSLEEVIRLIRGPKNTEVILLINRENWNAPQKITLKRKVIKIPVLKLEFKNLDKEIIAYLKIYQFNWLLPQEFKKIVEEILKSPAKKIILDIRNNPGGILDVAQDISGWFLEKGEIVVWQDKNGDKERKSYRAAGSAGLAKYPMVVLINQGSASAAEILAGALRDNKGVKLIGEKSFGKGSIQEQIFLQDNSSLKVTTGKWLTPKGNSLDERGLTPDVEVKMTEQDWQENKDPQLEKALEIIREIR